MLIWPSRVAPGGLNFGDPRMPDTATLSDDQFIRISENAAKRISQLVAQDERAGVMLRIAVSGGGCSGFQYGFELDDATGGDDRTFERGGIQVVVDETSLEFLKGAELDFVEDLIGSYFSLSNPNATSTCGCGSSFAV